MSSEFIVSLAEKSRQGDVDAFSELYGAFNKDMYRFAYYYTGDRELAADAVSSAAMYAFESISKLKRPDRFKSWLFKILYNECKKMQKEKMTAQSFVSYSEQIHIEYTDEDSLERIALRNALRRLGDEEKQLLILYYSCGYTYEEISSITGVKSATLRSRLSRATKKLRELMTI